MRNIVKVALGLLFVSGCQSQGNSTLQSEYQANKKLEECTVRSRDFGVAAVLATKPQLITKEAEAQIVARHLERMNQELTDFLGVSELPLDCLRSFYNGYQLGLLQWQKSLLADYIFEVYYAKNIWFKHYGFEPEYENIGIKKPLLESVPETLNRSRSTEYFKPVHRLYEKLFAHAGLPPETVFESLGTSDRSGNCNNCLNLKPEIVSQLDRTFVDSFQQAFTTGTMVRIGRFIFTPEEYRAQASIGIVAESEHGAAIRQFFQNRLPYTAFEYARNPDGSFIERDGELIKQAGTYETKINHLTRLTSALIEEFNRLRLSQSSFWTGSGRAEYERRMADIDTRRLKISHLMSDLDLHSTAPDFHKEIGSILNKTLEAERKFLDEAIARFNQIERNVIIYAPLTGAAILLAPVVLGTSTALTGIASLVGGSKVAAAAIITVTSLTAFTGVVASLRTHELSKATGIKWTDLPAGSHIDNIVNSLVDSLPIAPLAPFLVPSVYDSIVQLPTLLTTGRAWGGSAIGYISKIPAIGARGVAADASKAMTMHFGQYKFWGSVTPEHAASARQLWLWFLRGQVINYGVQLQLQFTVDDPAQKIWYTNEDGQTVLNPKVLVTLLSGTAGGIVGSPFAFAKTMGDRMMTGMAVSVLSAAMAETASVTLLEGERPFDTRRLSGALVYYGTFGHFLFFEPNRTLTWSPQVQNRSAATTMFLMLLIDYTSTLAETPVMNWYYDYWLKDGESPLDSSGEFKPGRKPSSDSLRILREKGLGDYFGNTFDFSIQAGVTDDVLIEALKNTQKSYDQKTLPNLANIVGSENIEPRMRPHVQTNPLGPPGPLNP